MNNLSNPITCGHFSMPDTSSSFQRFNRCQTGQHTQGRAGSLSLPTAADLRCLFLHATKKDSIGFQRMGWLIELSAAVLGSGWTARIYLYSLTTAAAISLLVLLYLWNNNITVLTEQSKEGGANQSNPSYQPASSAMRNMQGSSQSRTNPFSLPVNA